MTRDSHLHRFGDEIVRDLAYIGPPVLLDEVLRPQSGVDVSAVALQDVAERRAEIAIEAGVDDGIEEAVGVSQPQEESIQPVGDARLRISAEWFDEGEDEEGQPAGGERSHDHP